MAYSSVEHIGVQALGLGFGGVLGIAGALYHMLNHSLNKSLMFFGTGNAMRAYGSKEITDIRDVLRTFPVTGILWLLGAVGIAGAPPFALFLSEFTILRAGIAGSYRWAVVLFVIFLVVVFIGFLSHFRAMYFDETENPPMPQVLPAFMRSKHACGISSGRNTRSIAPFIARLWLEGDHGHPRCTSDLSGHRNSVVAWRCGHCGRSTFCSLPE